MGNCMGCMPPRLSNYISYFPSEPHEACVSMSVHVLQFYANSYVVLIACRLCSSPINRSFTSNHGDTTDLSLYDSVLILPLPCDKSTRTKLDIGLLR